MILSSLLSVLAPRVCLACEAPVDEAGLFCRECFAHVALLEGKGRCTGCFTQLRDGEKKRCRKCRKDWRVERRGALFEKSIELEALLCEKVRQRRLIASLFLLQWAYLEWPLFDYVACEPSLTPSGRVLAQMINKPFHRGGRLLQKEKVLYLATGLGREIHPFSIMCARSFHLNFFLPF